MSHRIPGLVVVWLAAGTAWADPVIEISLRTNDLVYDSRSDTIYVSVPSSVGFPRGNSITPIDPYSGLVGTSVFIGSEPSRLAIGDDGEFLYATINGGRAVRQFHIPTQTPGVQWSMPAGLTRVVEDIDVLPGNSESVVISRRYVGYSPSHGGVAVYDNGVARPVETLGFLGAGGPNRIAVNHDGTAVYGYDTTLSDHTFNTLAIDANGISITGGYAGVVDNSNADIVYEDGRLYTNYGQVIDAETRETLGNFAASGSVVPDAGLGRTFFLSGSTIKAFDNPTFLPVGEISVPGVVGGSGSLVRVGADRLAFRTTSDQVFVVPIQFDPEPSVLEFFDTAARAGTLHGIGADFGAVVRLLFVRRLLELGEAAVESEQRELAFWLLVWAYGSCDGLPRPFVDLVAGEAAPGLAAMILHLIRTEIL